MTPAHPTPNIRLEDEIDARFTKLEENQLEMALTLTRVVTLLEARSDAEPAPAGRASVVKRCRKCVHTVNSLDIGI